MELLQINNSGKVFKLIEATKTKCKKLVLVLLVYLFLFDDPLIFRE